MKYSKNDFDMIVAELERRLCEDVEDPLPCRLFEFAMPDNRDQAKMKGGTVVDHVADACNLASSIQGIYSLLTLVNDDEDCDRLSRVLVRELGALREAVQNAVEEQHAYEKQVLKRAGTSGFSGTPEEKNIRLWADVLKHPAATILAHQCFSETNEAERIIDTATMRCLEKKMRKICEDDLDVDGNTSKAWGKVWKDYSGATVQFNLPTVDEIKAFLEVIADRLQDLIDRRQEISTT
ncbi:hypothetical protein [Marinovum sp.]|uniref:hypothetical protein n=1 Tax=Marinovum sp. TaxID=2024839 RepID=UPI002B26D3F0|nr:hypothetical protein [Marinovum sp.]